MPFSSKYDDNPGIYWLDQLCTFSPQLLIK
jgi:hypothetical protein